MANLKFYIAQNNCDISRDVHVVLFSLTYIRLARWIAKWREWLTREELSHLQRPILHIRLVDIMRQLTATQLRVKWYATSRRARDAFIGRKTTLGIHDNEGTAKCYRNSDEEWRSDGGAKENPIAGGTRDILRSAYMHVTTCNIASQFRNITVILATI